MNALLFGWPYAGLIAVALPILVWLLRAPRPRDPAWLACLLLPVYAIHQFEEHGIDVLGRRNQFLTDLCATLARYLPGPCPADAGFVFAVNPGAVWLAGGLAIALRHRAPLVGACGFGIPLVNGFAHLAPWLQGRGYNAGLLTSAVLFLPISFWVLGAFRAAGLLRGARILAVPLVGVAVHVVLMAALIAHGRGALSYGPLLAIQVLNGLIPVTIGLWLTRASAAQPKGSAPAQGSTRAQSAQGRVG